MARAAYEDRDLEGALGYLAHARDLDPGNAAVHFFIGIVALELDLAIEARNSLERALALDAGNAFYHYALGGVILQTGQPGDAIPHFQEYSESRPNDPRGNFALGAAEFALDLGLKVPISAIAKSAMRAKIQRRVRFMQR